MATDEGPLFISYQTNEFFKQWGIKHRLSAAHYAQSNRRTEAVVKMAKRLLCSNIERETRINTKGLVKALLQYRNVPLLGIRHSPAQMLFGRVLKDALPTSLQKL